MSPTLSNISQVKKAIRKSAPHLCFISRAYDTLGAEMTSEPLRGVVFYLQ